MKRHPRPFPSEGRSCIPEDVHHEVAGRKRSEGPFNILDGSKIAHKRNSPKEPSRRRQRLPDRVGQPPGVMQSADSLGESMLKIFRDEDKSTPQQTQQTLEGQAQQCA
jgi:hypothetical protein